MKYKNMLLVGKAQIMANRKKSQYFQDEILMARCELAESRAIRRVVKPTKRRLSDYEIALRNHHIHNNPLFMKAI